MTLYYQYVDRNTIDLEVVALIIFIIAFVILQEIIVESPRFYVNKGKYKKARKSLTKIAAFNGVDADYYKKEVTSKKF